MEGSDVDNDGLLIENKLQIPLRRGADLFDLILWGCRTNKSLGNTALQQSDQNSLPVRPKIRIIEVPLIQENNIGRSFFLNNKLTGKKSVFNLILLCMYIYPSL